MVLARDLHKKIQDIQIKIEGSKRVAYLEQEISTLTKAVSLLVDKLSKPVQEEPEEELDEEYEQEFEKEQEELNKPLELPEEDDDSNPYEEEEEEEEDDWEEEEEPEERPDEEPLLCDQDRKKDQLINLSGYNEEREKELPKRERTVPFDWTETDEILADNYDTLRKRIIFCRTKNYSFEERIEYLKISCKNKDKYNTLKKLLMLIMSITNKRVNNFDEPIRFKISNTNYEFNTKRKYLVENLVVFFNKISKLKEKLFILDN